MQIKKSLSIYNAVIIGYGAGGFIVAYNSAKAGIKILVHMLLTVGPIDDELLKVNLPGFDAKAMRCIKLIRHPRNNQARIPDIGIL